MIDTHHYNSYLIWCTVSHCLEWMGSEKLRERLPLLSFLNIMSSCFPSLVPCLKLTL